MFAAQYDKAAAARLLLEGVVAHKNYTKVPEYDLVATNLEVTTSVMGKLFIRTIRDFQKYRDAWHLIKDHLSDGK